MKHFGGLTAAVYSPLDANGDLQLESIQPYVDFLVKNKVKRAFINGTTGHFSSLSLQERKLITEEWSRCKPAGFELMIHVGDTNLEQSLALAKHAGELNADAISSLAPYYYKVSSISELVHICKLIAEQNPEIPFYYYHIPQFTGTNLDMIEFLETGGKQIPNLAGIKYSDQNLIELNHCINFMDGKYQILFGVDEILLCALVLGVNGAVGSTYNYIAPMYHRMIEALESKQLENARKLQNQAMVFVRTLEKYGFHAASKATLKILGLDLGPVRLPLRNLTEDEISRLEVELRALLAETLG